MRKVVLAVALLGLVGWLFLRRGERKTVVASAPVSPSAASPGSLIRATIAPPDDPVPDVTRDDLPYRIAEITVDKPVVCRGEKTVVRVRAEHDQGKADWLVPVIGGRVGWVVSMVVPSTKPGRHKIPVQLSDPDGTAPDQPTPYVQKGAFVEVKECDTPASVWILATQETSVEEDVRFKASFHAGLGGASEAPVTYRWDFGDGSHPQVTHEPVARHLFPDEAERGPGKRVFSYLVGVDALDTRGKLLASGNTDVWLRNRYEEVERAEHRLALRTVYHPHPSVDASGDRTIDVSVHNLSAHENARLSSLEYRLVPCDANQAARVENHLVADVFSGSSVPPRGTLAGRLHWSKDAPSDICFIDVSMRGTSEPSALPIEGVFSMRARIDGPGLSAVQDPAATAALKQAMRKLGHDYVTREDLERLADQGEIDRSLSSDLIAGKGRRPLSEIETP